MDARRWTGAITGQIAYVRWHFYTAAQIDGYRVTRSGRVWEVQGRIALSDPFKLAQTPLVFVVPTKGGDWIWPIVRVVVEGDRFAARLGPPT